MADNQNTATGFPVRKQLFGGFKREDVTAYIEGLVTKVEAERAENEERKQQFYDLMQNGKTFCDELTAQAKLDAEALMAEAQQKADLILREASKQLQQLHEERERLLEQTRTELRSLTDIVSLQRQQTAQTFENILRPIATLLSSLEGDDNDS